VADGVAILSVLVDGFECGNRSRTIRNVDKEGFMLHAHASKLIWDIGWQIVWGNRLTRTGKELPCSWCLRIQNELRPEWY
jgi:hypothetical protein